jgi:MoaA/NifB/PqqE/SkfB family radical SAM enzyme
MWDAGARFGFLVDYVPIPGTLDPDLVLTEADRAVKHAAVAARVAEARPMVVNFPEAEYSSGGCMSAGTGFLHISATGAVEPCTFSHFSTHNLRTTSYVEALDSEFFRSVRGRFANRPNPTGTCLLFRHEAEVAQLARECAGAPTEEPVHL